VCAEPALVELNRSSAYGQERDAVGRNPEFSSEDRQRVLNHMTTIILAGDRRVDITVDNAGQTSQSSAREYPFHPVDSRALLS